jgi:hypothetical protein
MSSFRSGEEGASGLIWSEMRQSWLCGDSEGVIFSKSKGSQFVENRLDGGEPIVAIAVHPSNDECVVAENDTLSVRSVTSLDTEISAKIACRTLPYTDLQYDHSGRFL